MGRRLLVFAVVFVVVVVVAVFFAFFHRTVVVVAVVVIVGSFPIHAKLPHIFLSVSSVYLNCYLASGMSCIVKCAVQCDFIAM